MKLLDDLVEIISDEQARAGVRLSPLLRQSFSAVGQLTLPLTHPALDGVDTASPGQATATANQET